MWRSRQTSKGPLVVDAHVLYGVISSEPGLCCCLPSDSPRSVDILLLFVHCKAVHFPRIKSAFTRVCQDVFGAYLQLLSESESRACAQEQSGEGCFVPWAFLVKARTGSKAVNAHANTHQYAHTLSLTHTHTPTSSVFALSCTPSKNQVFEMNPDCKAHIHQHARYANYTGFLPAFVFLKGYTNMRLVNTALIKGRRVRT